MIEYQKLKGLVLEVLKTNPAQVGNVEEGVKVLIERRNLFPSREDCRKTGTNYDSYERKCLNPADIMNINQIIWDLIIDRVIDIGSDYSNRKWPFLRITEFGQSVVNGNQTSLLYDSDGYLKQLDEISERFDRVIKQYVAEALSCYRQRLFFASAVMIGAAAEAAILLLSQAIIQSMTRPDEKKKMQDILDRRGLPSLFDAIREYVQTLITSKIMPYAIHQGCMEHLLSFSEMIRVQRNEAVHPVVGAASREKVLLSIQTFPEACRVIYRIIGWFEQNRQ